MLTAVLLLLLPLSLFLLLPLLQVPCPPRPRPTLVPPPFLPLYLLTQVNILALLIRVLRLVESLMKMEKSLVPRSLNRMSPGHIRHRRNHDRFKRPAHHRQGTALVRRLHGDHHHRHPRVQVLVHLLQSVPTLFPGHCLAGHVHSGEL